MGVAHGGRARWWAGLLLEPAGKHCEGRGQRGGGRGHGGMGVATRQVGVVIDEGAGLVMTALGLRRLPQERALKGRGSWWAAERVGQERGPAKSQD